MAKRKQESHGPDQVDDLQAAIGLIRGGRLDEAKMKLQTWQSEGRWSNEIYAIRENQSWQRLWSFIEFLELDGSITPAAGEVMRNDLIRLAPTVRPRQESS